MNLENKFQCFFVCCCCCFTFPLFLFSPKGEITIRDLGDRTSLNYCPRTERKPWGRFLLHSRSDPLYSCSCIVAVHKTGS